MARCCDSPSASRRGVAVVVVTILPVLAACGDGSTPSSSSATTPTSTTTTVQDAAPPSLSPTSASVTSGAPASTPVVRFTITSPAFGAGAAIPVAFSCFGANQSPPLRWRGVPGAATELALVVDDPDAVGGRYLHWIVVGIGTESAGVRAGRLPRGATVLPNSGGARSYLGPCPPAGSGTHHYRFTLYALSHRPRLDPHAPAVRAEAEIRRAALATTRLVGSYAR